MEKQLEKLQNIFAKYSFLSDEIRRLKAEGELESSKCTSLYINSIGMVNGETCIQKCHEAAITGCLESDGSTSFELEWEIAVDDGDICEHCIKVRAIKVQRVHAQRRLGSVRANITKIGRKFNKDC